MKTKSIIRNSMFHATVSKSIYVISFIVLSTTAFAQDSVEKDSTLGPVSVQYLGAENDMMLIGVKFTNGAGNRFDLSIHNAEGDILYRNHYTEKNFEQKFKIPKQEGKLNFVVAGIKTFHDFEAYIGKKNSELVLVKKNK